MVNGNYKANYYIDYSDGYVNELSSEYISVNEGSKGSSYQFELVGIESDSVKMVEYSNHFPNIMKISKTQNKESILLENKRFFNLEKNVFGQNKVVVIVSYYPIDSLGGVKERPFYLNETLIKWQLKNTLQGDL